MRYVLSIFLIVFFSCNTAKSKNYNLKNNEPFIIILGVAQDAGCPQVNSNLSIDKRAFNNLKNKRLVVSLGLLDPITNKAWLFDATPDFTLQLQHLKNSSPQFRTLAGIFLTHAHIGHYTGLMYLGREAMGAKNVPVYAMPKMTIFLKTNQPWKQLVDLKNINLKLLKADSAIVLNKRLKVTPILVPHRDELSETVGFIIKSTHKSLLFIPDINKWQMWDKNINNVISSVDYALIDGTFFKAGEIKNRSMAEIPHPFVSESMKLFKSLSKAAKKKVYFIHFNHTNPLLVDGSKAQKVVLKNGYNFAKELQIIPLN